MEEENLLYAQGTKIAGTEMTGDPYQCMIVQWDHEPQCLAYQTIVHPEMEFKDGRMIVE